FVDRKSRFIAQLAPVGSEADANEFISMVRSRHHDARHNVPAWILADGRERCSDDGEPQRTAGMPVLEVLRGAGLANVCCVVTRYFGGTLLGPGGLVRAYASAAQKAVEEAERAGDIVEMTMVTRVTVTIPYGAYGRVERLVSDCSGKVRDTIFSEEVQMNCAFPTGTEGAFLHAMCDLSGGEDLCVVGEPTFQEF
ncbi:MAG: YigZ family protein, partial [Olsenella sp.]|nr:YigZ family protein [Olsenella sp.]